MKKVILLFAIIIFSSSQISAQAWDGIGARNLSAGVEFYGYGTGAVVNFDYGLLEDVSVGAGMNYSFDASNLYVNARADYHFQRLLKLPSVFDIYGGLDVGYNTNFDPNVRFGVRAGARYMIFETVGLYLEVGSRGNVGMVFNI